MGEWPEATYAALCQTYSPRDPFTEFGHGLIDLNTLRILVVNLPLDSAMHRASSNSRGWLPGDYLTATGIDALGAIFNMLNVQVDVQAGRDAEYVPPEPIERPGDGVRREQEQQQRIAEVETDKAWVSSIEAITGVGR